MRYKIKKSQVTLLGLSFLLEGCKLNNSTDQKDSQSNVNALQHSVNSDKLQVELRVGARLYSIDVDQAATAERYMPIAETDSLGPLNGIARVTLVGNLSVISDVVYAGILDRQSSSRKGRTYVKATDIIPSEPLLSFFKVDTYQGFALSDGRLEPGSKSGAIDSLRTLWNKFLQNLTQRSLNSTDRTRPITRVETRPIDSVDPRNWSNWSNWSNWGNY
jgi:hypothetical protein